MSKKPLKKFTRSEFECPLFGYPRNFFSNKLPTYEDVLRCCFEERMKLAAECNNKKVNFSVISGLVAKKVMVLYKNASIPTVSEYRIIQLINVYHDKYYKLRKSYNRDKEKEFFRKRIEHFKKKAAKLFDVSACKCIMNFNCHCKKNPDHCQCPVLVNCRCEKAKKNPNIEKRFIYLQRMYGLGKIGTLDKNETKKLENKLKRKFSQSPKRISEPISSETICIDTDTSDVTMQLKPSHSEKKDYDYKLPSSAKNTSPLQKMRLKLKTTALHSDRYRVSERATAVIASSVLEDVGLITKEDFSQVIDKSKIRREKIRNRTEIRKENLKSVEALRGIYFDGRNDETLVIEKMGSKQFRRTKKEEHYSLIKEPGSIYIGHVSPCSGKAIDIARSILSFLKENEFSLEDLDFVGCDGTNINTGWKNGVIHHLEVYIGRPLQWAICLLHFNELPLRHMFKHLDGESKGPNSFCGPIGRQLIRCETLPIVAFEPIEIIIPEVDRDVLSCDQKYLLDISLAIKTGSCSNDLSHRNPGSISLSRWLTTANRILRLYVSSEIPSDELKILVKFITKTYMPLWFQIKSSSQFTDGPLHIYRAIEASRFLPDHLKQVVDPVIERNAFFAHHENILVAMIFDKRPHIRELGLRRVLKARECVSKGKSIRNFVTPKINFNASEYTELIDWKSTKICPPPVLRNITDDEIRSLIQSAEIPKWDLTNFPCHTQAVERCVKLVSEASLKVCGSESRDGYIRTSLLSRSIMPKFSKKTEYRVALHEK